MSAGKHSVIAIACALMALALGGGVRAADPKEQPAAQADAQFAWQDAIRRQTGAVPLPQAKATLNLGEDYYFIGPEDARKVLVEGWGNPPDAATGVLGMVFPVRFKPMDDGAWGAVVTYEESGYVADNDARKIDGDKLLEDLRKSEADENKQRQENHYPALHLAGWAEPPAYDAASHTAIWARDIAVDGKPNHTLNYGIRVLGRRGVISLDVISALSDLSEVKAAAGRIGQIADYNPGERYADHKSGDKKAAYGVAGLIAAGVGVAALKKAGLLGFLLLFGKKAFVIIAAGFAAAVAWLRRIFGGGKTVAVSQSATSPTPAAAETPPPALPTNSGDDIVT